MRLELLKSTKEEQEFLDNSLGDFNIAQVPATQQNHLEQLSYCYKDSERIIAGINAFMYYWHVLYIDILFVDKDYRCQGLGKQLLQKAESEAKILGAKLSHLNTFDFQAKDFYLKYGYKIFGVLNDCPKDHDRYYMKKDL